MGGGIFLKVYNINPIIIIIIIIRSEKEPDMEPPDRPQGAEHQYAVCSLESIQAITQCLTPL